MEGSEAQGSNDPLGLEDARPPVLLEPSECEEVEVGEVTGSQGRLGLAATVNL